MIYSIQQEKKYYKNKHSRLKNSISSDMLLFSDAVDILRGKSKCYSGGNTKFSINR